MPTFGHDIPFRANAGCWHHILAPPGIILRPEEVARAFIVPPLSFLKDPANRYYQDFVHESQSHPPVLYFKRYDGELIWGITAQIILQFLEIIES